MTITKDVNSRLTPLQITKAATNILLFFFSPLPPIYVRFGAGRHLKKQKILNAILQRKAVMFQIILMEAIISRVDCKISILIGYYRTMEYITPKRLPSSRWHDGNIPMCWRWEEQYVILDYNKWEETELCF